jgi:hypothetical protein
MSCHARSRWTSSIRIRIRIRIRNSRRDRLTLPRPFAHLTEHVAPIEGDAPQIPAIG